MSKVFSKNFLYFLKAYLIFGLGGIILLLTFNKGDLVILINANATPFGDVFFQIVTFLGLGGVFAIPILLMLFVKYSYAIAGTISLILTGLFTYLFKQILFKGMPRPTGFFQGGELVHFIEGFEYHTMNSFPSGHTMTAFALAAFLAICVKNKYWNVSFLFLAVLIGLSRMYLLQHFLMDVLLGSLLGIICTLLGFYIAINGLENKFPILSKRINFPVKK